MQRIDAFACRGRPSSVWVLYFLTSFTISTIFWYSGHSTLNNARSRFVKCNRICFHCSLDSLIDTISLVFDRLISAGVMLENSPRNCWSNSILAT